MLMAVRPVGGLRWAHVYELLQFSAVVAGSNNATRASRRREVQVVQAARQEERTKARVAKKLLTAELRHAEARAARASAHHCHLAMFS